MNRFLFAVASLCACILTLAACGAAPPAQPIAAPPIAAPAQLVAASEPLAGTPATRKFAVLAPRAGQTIARLTEIRGSAPVGGKAVSVTVAVQPAGGTWYDQGSAPITPNGTWSVPGYFGGADTPEGSKFKVRAQLVDAAKKIIGEQSAQVTRTNAQIVAPVAPPQAPAQEHAQPMVMGYYPSYRTELPPAQIRADRFTHAIYSFAKADAQGALDATSSATFPAFVSAVHAHGIKAILGLSGGGNAANFAVMVHDTAKRAAFVKAVSALVKTTGADGIALDWEQPEAQDKPLTTQLVKQLRAGVKAAQPDAILVLVVNSQPYNGRGYDGPALRGSVDYLHIMAYDFHGSWNEAGHHTNLFPSDYDKKRGEAYSYPDALKYWRDTQGFATDKILMGIVGYGRGFRVPDWGVKETSASRYPEITYADITALIGQGWTRQWDAQAHAPWLLSDDGTERISYDDPQSVADKAAWMKEQGLPGFFIWELAQEYQGSDNVLTAAALQAWEAPVAK